jgi:hypothetical protein
MAKLLTYRCCSHIPQTTVAQLEKCEAREAPPLGWHVDNSQYYEWDSKLIFIVVEEYADIMNTYSYNNKKIPKHFVYMKKYKSNNISTYKTIII